MGAGASKFSVRRVLPHSPPALDATSPTKKSSLKVNHDSSTPPLPKFDQSWTASAWLSGVHVEAAVVQALFPPEKLPNGSKQLKDLKGVGALGDSEAVREVLKERLLSGDIVSKLADLLLPHVIDLATAPAASAAELHSKFVAEGSAFTLDYSGLSTFFGGLEAKIGTPKPKERCAGWDGLAGVLASEHRERDDSASEFTANNYGTTTTSMLEHAFCAAPDDAPPSSPSSTGGSAAASTVAGPHNPQWPAESKLAADSEIRRRPMPLSALRELVASKNALLETHDEPLLLEVEAVAARLYTGPMFVKYNAVLRGYESAVPFLRKQFEALCKGNTYTTTNHVINSAIVKLSKLTRVTKVYRGVSGGVLPDAFWRPNQFNVCGGIESAFMSTTVDPTVAHHYAAAGKSGTSGMVFEIMQGMVDRGAELYEFSQYPHEREITFAPLTGVEVQSTAVSGTLIKLKCRLSVNLSAPTIEAVLAKRKKVVTDMASTMSDSLERELHAPQWGEFASMMMAASNFDAVSHARDILRSSLKRTTAPEAEYFNDDQPLGKAIQSAVEARRSVDFPRGLALLEAIEFGNRSTRCAELYSGPSSSAQGAPRRRTTIAKRIGQRGKATRPFAETVKWLTTSGIEKLDFTRTTLGDEGVGALALILMHIPNSLQAAGAVGIQRLCMALSEKRVLPELRELNLGTNQLNDAGIMTLGEALRAGAMPKLRELDLHATGCGNDGLGALADVLPGPAVLRELKEFDLSDNAIGDDGMGRLADAMNAGAIPHVTQLRLGANEIGDEGTARLAAALSGPSGALTHLIELELDNNWVGNAGAAALAAAFGQGCLSELRVLALDDNLIGDSGAISFAEACLAHPSGALPALIALDLDGSEIGDEGFDKVAEALRANALPSLKTLEVDDDELGHSSLNAACEQRGVILR